MSASFTGAGWMYSQPKLKGMSFSEFHSAHFSYCSIFSQVVLISSIKQQSLSLNTQPEAFLILAQHTVGALAVHSRFKSTDALALLATLVPDSVSWNFDMSPAHPAKVRHHPLLHSSCTVNRRRRTVHLNTLTGNRLRKSAGSSHTMLSSWLSFCDQASYYQV